jgi:uncharacterized surface protein with fasciclin (FAS1) repeats
MQNILIVIGVEVVGAVLALTLMGGGEDQASTPTESTSMAENNMETETTNVETAPEPMETQTEPDIVDVAMAADDFNTLVATVSAAGLVETLKSDGPFTVFAPTDAAFDALPEGTVESLLEPANQADLTAILTYHVVPTEVLSGELTDGMVVETVNGDSLTIGVTDSGVTVNGANVVTADIETSNGVIHVVDSVLLPPTE